MSDDAYRYGDDVFHLESEGNKEKYVNQVPFESIKIKSPLVRECMSEALGTCILILFGDGVVAQTVLSKGKNGSHVTIFIAWGLAVMFGIFVSHGISGAHMNPAVTISLAVWKRFEWKKVPYYVLSQVWGAFVGAMLVFCAYYVNIQEYTKETAGIFATYPQASETALSGFVSEVIGSALLLCGIFAICDSKNLPASPFSKPFAVGLLVVAIGMSFGWKTGYAINPARDFGPRLLTLLAGWGTLPFTADHYYFWIPIAAPIVGGVIGASTYMLLIELHH